MTLKELRAKRNAARGKQPKPKKRQHRRGSWLARKAVKGCSLCGGGR